MLIHINQTIKYIILLIIYVYMCLVEYPMTLC